MSGAPGRFWTFFAQLMWGEGSVELGGAKHEAQSEDWDREREVGSDEEGEDSGQESCSGAAARREGGGADGHTYRRQTTHYL